MLSRRPIIFRSSILKLPTLVEDIGKLAPEAGYLLTVAFPSLTLEQADQILTDTEGAGGGFLDDGSSSSHPPGEEGPLS
jgi:hypothetical protein